MRFFSILQRISIYHRPTTSPAFWISLLFRSIQMCASIGLQYKISIRFSSFIKLDLLRIYIMLQPIGLALEIEYHMYPTKTTPLSSWKKAYQWEIFSRHRKSCLLSWRSRASPLQLPCWSRHCGQNGLDLLLELEQFKVCSIRSYYIYLANPFATVQTYHSPKSTQSSYCPYFPR